jgi:predicted amidohydrolase YtcJ
MTGNGDTFYRIGPLKILGDGSLGARTAYLSIPYASDSSTQGMLCFDAKIMEDMIVYAHKMGMQIAVHAIGDACLDVILDAYEKALTLYPRDDHRHGIVHMQISRKDQLERMAKLKLHSYAQTIFLDYDIHIVEECVGKELASTSYSWKSLMNMGLSVSNGTDCPVEMPNALAGMQCAITRTDRKGSVEPYLLEQAFSVKEALDSYTTQSAYASFDEKIKGKIQKDYLADFVVLDKNPFTVEASTIQDIQVLETYVAGKCVYQK